jgi:hypothetical protein
MIFLGTFVEEPDVGGGLGNRYKTVGRNEHVTFGTEDTRRNAESFHGTIVHQKEAELHYAFFQDSV